MTVLHVHPHWHVPQAADVGGLFRTLAHSFLRGLEDYLMAQRRVVQSQHAHPVGRHVPARVWRHHSALLAEAQARRVR